MQINLKDKNLEENLPFGIGEKITFYRKKKGLSQEQLAEKIGKSRQMVSYYEKNKGELTLNLLDKITKVLDITIPDLFLDVAASSSERIKALETEIENLKNELKDKLQLINVYERTFQEYTKQLEQKEQLQKMLIEKTLKNP